MNQPNQMRGKSVPSEPAREFKNENEHVRYLAMRDSARNSLITLPIIMVLETYMLITWVIRNAASPRSIGYPICYASLFVLSAVVILITLHVRKDLEKRYRLLVVTQDFYAIFFIIWALALTVLDAESNQELSVIVYMTIAILVPVMCFASPVLWGVVYAISELLIIYLAMRYEAHITGFITNFTVFTLMAFVAQFAYHTARRNSFRRQIELENMAEINYNYAYKDSLTGLYNRRSFTEKMDELENSPDLPASLILVAFDVNGLKFSNDSLGHDAGDELLRGASSCMTQAFGELGTLYRTGGDEFFGILETSDTAFREASEKFSSLCNSWAGEKNASLSVSVGAALRSEHPEATLDDLNKAADADMYESKKRYYKESGRERRCR